MEKYMNEFNLNAIPVSELIQNVMLDEDIQIHFEYQTDSV